MNKPFVTRRRLLAALAVTPFAALLASRRGPARAAEPPSGEAIAPLRKSNEEWRRLLEPRRYEVLFEADTERPNSSPLNAEKRPGTFICAACFLPLFDARHKYESGTGWPSFTDHIPGRLQTERDFSMIWPRTEYHCIRCGGHQGHVFDDGPPPTNQRWCNNGLALLFVPEGSALPELRT